MAIVIRQEDAYTIGGKLCGLLNKHGLEVFGPSTNVNLRLFAGWVNAGLCYTFVLWDGDTPVGYTWWLDNSDPMFANKRRVDEIAIYVEPKYRGKWAVRLMRYAELALIKMGYNRLVRYAKRDSALERVFKKMGYGSTEVMMFKEV